MYSGTFFPKKVGSFKIIGPSVFKPENVGVGYFTRSGIELTQFIYPADGSNADSSLNEEYEECRNYYLKKPNLKITEEGDYNYNGVAGTYLAYENYDKFHGINQHITSHLYLFVSEGWYVKIRVTHPVRKTESSTLQIQEYLKSIPWPSRKYGPLF